MHVYRWELLIYRIYNHTKPEILSCHWNWFTNDEWYHVYIIDTIYHFSLISDIFMIKSFVLYSYIFAVCAVLVYSRVIFQE